MSSRPIRTLAPGDHAGSRSFVQKIVRKVLKSSPDVEDVVQDALLKAYRFRDSFRGDSAYSSWLYRVATSTAVRHVTRARKRALDTETQGADGEATLDRVPGTSNVAAAFEHGEALQTVGIALNKLSPVSREVFLEHVRDGYVDSELVTRHGLSMAAVRGRIFDARKAIVTALTISEVS